MRPGIIFVTVLLGSLVLAGAALAEDHNELGLYTDSDDLTSYTTQMFSPGVLELYLVILNPFDEETGTPIDNVNGFECRVEMDDPDLLLSFNSPFLNVSIAELPDILVGFAEPIPVVDGQVTLGYLLAFSLAEEGTYTYLKPISMTQSIPGLMVYSWFDYQGGWSNLSPLYPVSGDFADPVFAVNGTVIDAESETWGGVKALYR